MRRRKSKPRTTRAAKSRPRREHVKRPNGLRSDSPGAKSFAVLARTRRTGEDPVAVSRQMGTYFAVVRRRLPGQFRKVKGQWLPTKSDRLPRRKRLLTEDGYIAVTVRGSKKASELNQYNQIVNRFVRGKDHDPSALLAFKGKRIAGRPYLTDPEKVFRLADAGLIRTDELGSDQVARGGRR